MMPSEKNWEWKMKRLGDAKYPRLLSVKTEVASHETTVERNDKPFINECRSKQEK